MDSDNKKEESYWKSHLTEAEYHITRERGTEPAFTGKYWDFHGDGIYKCACCGIELFDSETKFESGSGWPSFFQPVREGIVDETSDKSFGMIRTEAVCHNCGAHLGHVFEDGPKPTGLRYCVNSAALKFAERKR